MPESSGALPAPAWTDYQSEPGRVVCKPLWDEDDNYYWHAFIGDMRVNGGMSPTYADGMIEGKRAIAIWRKKDFYENFMFDVESGKWIAKGSVS